MFQIFIASFISILFSVHLCGVADAAVTISIVHSYGDSVSAERMWQGVGTAKLVITDGTWSTSTAVWATLHDKTSVLMSNQLPSTELYGFERCRRRVIVPSEFVFTSATEISFRMHPCPGFVTNVYKEFLSLSADNAAAFLATGQSKITAGTRFELIGIDSMLSTTPVLIRYHGNMFDRPHGFSEQDVRRYGITMRLALLYDVWTDASQISLSGFKLAALARAYMTVNTPNNLNEVWIRLPPQPTYNIDSSEIVHIRYSSATYRRDPAQGNFTILSMPFLTCTLRLHDGSGNVITTGAMSEQNARSGKYAISVDMSGSDYIVGNITNNGTIREQLRRAWTCQHPSATKGAFGVSTALNESHVWAVGSRLFFNLSRDTTYDINNAKDPETCRFTFPSIRDVIATGESCSSVSVRIDVTAGTLTTTMPTSVISEDKIRAGTPYELVFNVEGDKFVSPAIVASYMTFKSFLGTFASVKSTLIPTSNFQLSENRTYLVIRFGKSTAYDIPKAETVAIDFPKECFDSNLAPNTVGALSFVVVPVSATISWTLMPVLTKRNLTLGPMADLEVTLHGDFWERATERFIGVAESPDVGIGGFLSVRNYIMPNAAISFPVDKQDKLIIKFAPNATAYTWNRDLSVVLTFPANMISSGLLPANGNKITLNITQITGTVSIVPGTRSEFQEDEVRAGQAKITLDIEDDNFLSAENMHTIRMCDNAALCPIPLSMKPIVQPSACCPQQRMIIVLGTSTFDVGTNVSSHITIPPSGTRSGLQPKLNTTFYIRVVPGTVSLGFEGRSGDTSITEHELRTGAAPRMYIDLKYDRWVAQAALIREVLGGTVNSATTITSSLNPDPYCFQQLVKALLGEIAIVDDRMYVVLQAHPLYDVNAKERVKVTLPSILFSSGLAPVQELSFYVNVSTGKFFLSGSFTGGIDSHEIRDPGAQTLVIVLTLEGERWTTSDKLYDNLVARVQSTGAPSGFGTLRSKLLLKSMMSVSDARDVITFTLPRVAEYMIRENEVVTFNVPANAVQSNLVPESANANTFSIVAVAGQVSVSPLRVNETASTLGFSIEVTVQDGSSQWSQVVAEQLYANINSASAQSSEPNGFTTFKSTMLTKVATTLFSVARDRLKINFQAQPSYNIQRPERISIALNSSWFAPALQTVPNVVSFTIFPLARVMYAVLEQDHTKWGDGAVGDSVGWIRVIASSLGISTARVVLEDSGIFTKFEQFTTMRGKSYTYVRFHFTDSVSLAEKSAGEAVATMRGYTASYLKTTLRVIALVDYAAMLKLDPDWRQFTPERIPPTPGPNPPAESNWIFLIVGVFAGLIVAMFIYYKVNQEGASVAGGSRTKWWAITKRHQPAEDASGATGGGADGDKKDSSHDHTIEMTEQPLLVDDNDLDVGMFMGQQEHMTSFRRGGTVLPKGTVRQRDVPIIHVGQSTPGNNRNNNKTQPPPPSGKRPGGGQQERSQFITQVLDEFNIPVGAVYPRGVTGPRVRQAVHLPDENIELPK
eukprot:PhM_4_TR5399/c0_g1_i1/m.65290